MFILTQNATGHAKHCWSAATLDAANNKKLALESHYAVDYPY
ncbi:hypothetical protein Q7C_2067 [Methylophaga frappieri]|uniref:Uncharacterized protein n=1 Tax=Methylophaga frappieri (strain ATCC BAA-2434 / DSM 25690 / JAM7) TaxID=754477 RepID=I1YJW3_METFJ|nr:hypothetical protein Q7C_2067 [Methylophaga frappieri]